MPTHPSHVGEWDYYGCLGSTDSFPTFSLAETSGSNSIEQCTSECLAGGFLFAGLHTTDCYCAGSIDAGTCAEKANGVCNLPCPGNSLETCGGNAISNSLLDVYECNKPTPTSSSSSSTSEPTSDPSSDPDPAPVPRGLDADMEIAQPRARDVKLRRGGLLQNPKVQQGPTLAKRDFGIKQPFGQ
jgi:WSC domain